jgi:mono/diheme cytochrome c family protein
MLESLRQHWTRVVATTALSALGLVAVVDARTAQAATERPVLAQAQRGAQTPAQPSAAGNAAAGARQLYDRVCGRCHPGGEEDIGPRLRDRNDPEAEVRATIRNGHGRMRPITTARLSDAQLETLIPYLRTQLHAVR